MGWTGDPVRLTNVSAVLSGGSERETENRYHSHLMSLQASSSLGNQPYTAAAAAKSLQSCPTLCDPTDSSPQGSPVPGILQARTLEWVAISFSNAWKWKVNSLSRVRLLVTPWTAAHQAPLSMGFSRQECWSGCHWLCTLFSFTYYS